MSPGEWMTLFAWSLGTGGMLGWIAHGLRQRLRGDSVPRAEILAVMRIEIRGQGVTCYLDAAALEEAAGLAGYALVKLGPAPSVVRH